MTYPGDPSLTPDVQQRILGTYQQTLQLAAAGSRQEALLACDFVLRLDPRFGPARALQQMIQSGSPAAAFQELLAAAPPAAAPSRPAAPAFEGLADLELPAAPEPAPAAPAGDLLARLSALVESRSFPEAIALADAERRAVAADSRLRQLVDQAHSRLEAEPYLKTFLDSARQALQAGETDEFERLLRKARTLDASHPGIAELEQARGFYSDPDRALAGRRPGAKPAAAAVPAAAEVPPAAIEAGFELPDLDFSFPAADESFELEAQPAPEPGTGAGEGRIAELLREGQAAFERAEYQGAIDSWSRIFLIDIDHREAARRIEQARQLKAEREREVEEIFHDAVARFDAGDFAGAREIFERVLALQPGYVIAQEYLEKIAERASGSSAAVAAALPEQPLAASAPPAPPAARRAAAREPLSEEILVPPDPTAVARPERRAAAQGVARSAKKRAGAAPRFLLVGGAVLALAVAAGWFVATRWQTLFPNSQAPEAPAAALVDPLARARELHAEGKTALAIPQLRRIPPQDPRYAEAQSLISQWEALEREAAQPKLSPAQAASRRAWLDRAARSLAAGDNVRARAALAQARQIAPLDGDAAQLAATAEERLQPFAAELELYSQGDYEYVLNQLWRRRETEKDNPDLDHLIVDSYYNLGVLDLQRGDPAAALGKFAEARKLEGDDPGLIRLERFARAYETRGEDLLYRIFVKYLSVR